jgi:hypothetical protein
LCNRLGSQYASPAANSHINPLACLASLGFLLHCVFCENGQDVADWDIGKRMHFFVEAVALEVNGGSLQVGSQRGISPVATRVCSRSSGRRWWSEGLSVFDVARYVWFK